MNALMLGLWCAAAAGAPPAPPLPQEPVAIAVMMFSAPDAALASVVTARAAQSIRALGVFQVVDPEMAMGLLRAEAARELTGCTDASCLAELAGLVGAAQLVSGSVTRTADVYQVHVVLIDQRTTSVMDGVVVTVKELRDVGNAVDGAAVRVVRKLLEHRVGELQLLVNERGADVKIDDVLVGVTPLRPRMLPMGPHRVVVEKTGFIVNRQDVQVVQGGTQVVRLDLSPSQEFMTAYRRRNLLLRASAAAAAGVAITAAVVGVGSYLAWVSVFVGAYQGGAAAAVGNLVNPSPDAVVLRASDLGDRRNARFVLNMLLGVVLVAPALVLASGTLGLVLFALSEDPGRYNAYTW